MATLLHPGRVSPIRQVPAKIDRPEYVGKDRPTLGESDVKDADTIIEPNMTFTIEPMLTLGKIDYDIWPDGWTAVTKDRKRTAQFEHTILVTEDGSEILTQP